MRAIIVLVILGPSILFAQHQPNDEIPLLIKKLASANFLQRQTAIEALKKRPEAEKALRDALRSGDIETRRHAAEILDYFDKAPVRELNMALQEGRIDRFVLLISAWPAGKHNDEVWNAVKSLRAALIDLHEKKGGEKIYPLPAPWTELVPTTLSATTINEATKHKEERGCFLRANKVDVDYRRLKPGEPINWLHDLSVAVVARDAVEMPTSGSQRHIIFAGGSVHLEGGGMVNSIIVSGGDIKLKNREGIARSLFIARGNVTIEAEITSSRIVAGKSISTSESPKNCIISENDANPLGFIRWFDAAKDKVVPKSK